MDEGDIIDHPGDHLPGPPRFMEADGHDLQVLEKLETEIGHDPLSDILEGVVLEKSKNCLRTIITKATGIARFNRAWLFLIVSTWSKMPTPTI